MKKGKLIVGITYRVTYRSKNTNAIYTNTEVIKYESFEEYHGITEEYRTKCIIRDRINMLTIKKYYKEHNPDWIIYEIEIVK